MPISADLLQAKQVLSARLLRAGLRGDVIRMSRTISVSAAVASASSNVHGVGVGRKIVDGKPTNQPCVRLYVIQKLAPSLLSPRDVLPDEIDGIPTDIIETPVAFLQQRKRAAKKRARKRRAVVRAAALSCSDDKRKRQRPVVAGISAAHFHVTAGTISYFCRSTRQGDDPTKVYVLSNNHVLADTNRGQKGDDLYQPGPGDGGISNDHFAELHRFVPLKLGGVEPNRVDAAIGELLPGVAFNLAICGIGKITGTRTVEEKMLVRKHGRTTGYSEGYVSDPSVDQLVSMDDFDPNIVALFQDQMRIDVTNPFKAFAKPGDSGSLVVHRTAAQAVGLYNAGPESGEYGLANRIEDVLSELQIELL